MSKTSLTIAPVAVSCGADPEFVDLAGLEKGWCIRRGHAYQLISDGEIRSVVLRRKGRIRGKRLVEVASVRKWLSAQAVDPHAKFARQVRAANKLSVAARRQNRADALMA
jgi:hypothetical protein